MFVFENGIALDSVSGVSVRNVNKFYDGAPPYSEYILSIDSIDCLFRAYSYYEPIEYINNGKKIRRMSVFGVYIVDSYLRGAISSARKGAGLPPLSDPEYVRLREILKPGMFCLVTRGREEEVLRYAPNFYVGFVDNREQVPPNKPLNVIEEEK